MPQCRWINERRRSGTGAAITDIGKLLTVEATITGRCAIVQKSPELDPVHPNGDPGRTKVSSKSVLWDERGYSHVGNPGRLAVRGSTRASGRDRVLSVDDDLGHCPPLEQ